jgi:hypothetical protein
MVGFLAGGKGDSRLKRAAVILGLDPRISVSAHIAEMATFFPLPQVPGSSPGKTTRLQSRRHRFDCLYYLRAHCDNATISTFPLGNAGNRSSTVSRDGRITPGNAAAMRFRNAAISSG